MMKTLLFSIICMLSISIIGCTKDEGNKNEDIIPSKMVPFLNLGTIIPNNATADTLFITANMKYRYDTTTIVIDSSAFFTFYISSYYISASGQCVYTQYFEKFSENAKISFLRGMKDNDNPLISTYNIGDTIKIQNDESFGQWTYENGQPSKKTYLRKHLYTIRVGEQYDLPMGENYIVIKFGEVGNERLGWFTLVNNFEVHQYDGEFHLKEGYYTREANTEMIIGEK